MKQLFLFFVLCTAILLPAQELLKKGDKVRIVTPGDLYSSYGLSENTDDQEELKANGVSETELREIMAACEEGQWPSGITDLDSRVDNPEQMKNYMARFVAYFGDYAIIRIVKEDNLHMPADWVAVKPFYFIYRASAINLAERRTSPIARSGSGSSLSNTGSTAPIISMNPVPCKIITSMDLYSTLNFDDQPELKQLLYQITEGKGDEIIKYAHESTWPEGIATFDAREKVRDEMLKYKAYKLVCDSKGMCVIKIPAAENRHMPKGLIPRQDIYWAIKSTAIE